MTRLSNLELPRADSDAFGTGPGAPPPAWPAPGHRIAVRGRTHPHN